MAERIAFVFPGQGSQFSGMGREFAESDPAAREVFETADRVLELSISELCFSGSDVELALTENTQPAILTSSIAALRALESMGVRPAAAAGHSLGEYSAHVAAGSFEFEDAVRAVRQRGEFMQQAVPLGTGTMAAVLGLDRSTVEQLCDDAAAGEIVSPANYNSPEQTVVAGHVAAVERVIELAKQAGAMRAMRLSVSAPFHCALMRPAAERLRPVLEDIEFRGPAFPVYTNVDVDPVSDGAEARQSLLRQVDSPVRWQEQIERMLADGIETFVEIGPGKVLSGLIRRIQRGTSVHRVGTPAEAAAVVEALGSKIQG